MPALMLPVEYHFTYIETERLKLRLITPEVYEHLFRHYTAEQWQSFFGFNTVEDAEKEMARLSGGIVSYNRTVLLFVIIDKESDKAIGACGYHNWYQQHKRAEVGYMMHNLEFRQKGLMKEAFHKIVDYGFNEMGLERIEAFIAKDNEASLRLLKGLGFQYEGNLRKHYMVNGVLDDSQVFGLLKADFSH